jgi:hypothetical protein
LQLCVPAEQLPLAHEPASVSDVAPAGQVAAEHEVPSAYFWQPPAPSHLPFVPQLAFPWSAQKLGGAAEPAAIGAHAPDKLPTLQAWQGWQLAFAQHTPSVQWLAAPPHW